MSEPEGKPPIADMLMFAGQVTQGIGDARGLNKDWTAWAVKVVTTMGRLLDSYDREVGCRYADTAHAERAEFLLAVAAACAKDRRSDFDYEAVSWIREQAKRVVGSNCTFVDDDLKLLAHLAERAVLSGLTTDLPPSIQASIERVYGMGLSRDEALK